MDPTWTTFVDKFWIALTNAYQKQTGTFRLPNDDVIDFYPSPGWSTMSMWIESDHTYDGSKRFFSVTPLDHGWAFFVDLKLWQDSYSIYFYYMVEQIGLKYLAMEKFYDTIIHPALQHKVEVLMFCIKSEWKSLHVERAVDLSVLL